RRLKRHRIALRRQMTEEFRQALPALPGSDETAPVSDRHVDGRQSARPQDRAGNNDARRRLLIDYEPGTDGQNCRLEQKAKNLRRRAQATADIAGAAAGRDVVAIELMPASGHAPDHAHGRDRLRIATACFQQRVARHGELRGASGRVTGLDLGDQRKNNKNDGAEQRGKADQSVKQKTNRQLNRHPWQIEKSNRPASGKKAPHGIEIPNGLYTFAFGPDLERQTDDRVIDPPTHRLVEAAADSDQDAAPDRVNYPLGGI